MRGGIVTPQLNKGIDFNNQRRIREKDWGTETLDQVRIIKRLTNVIGEAKRFHWHREKIGVFSTVSADATNPVASLLSHRCNCKCEAWAPAH